MCVVQLSKRQYKPYKGIKTLERQEITATP